MRWICLLLTLSLHAETGYRAWLRYAPLASPPSLPAVVSVTGDSLVLRTAQQELIAGIRGMTGRIPRAQSEAPLEPAIVLQAGAAGLAPDAWSIQPDRGNIRISGGSDRGVLYGVFALLRKIALGEPITATTESPRVTARWVNEWNNPDGTMRRGYGG